MEGLVRHPTASKVLAKALEVTSGPSLILLSSVIRWSVDAVVEEAEAEEAEEAGPNGAAALNYQLLANLVDAERRVRRFFFFFFFFFGFLPLGSP